MSSFPLSLEKVIKDNEASPHEVFCWHHEKNYCAIRKGDWKLLRNPKDPSGKGELTNQAARYPEKVEELKKDYIRCYQSITKV